MNFIKIQPSRGHLAEVLIFQAGGVNYLIIVIKSSRGFSFIAFFILFLSTTPSFAGTDLRIPPEYGEVVFRYNEKSPNQVFIIGMSHRDTLTRTNGSNTSKVQAEVYKIGDWLIQNEQLDLLLPEGFFRTEKPKAENSKVLSTRSLDIKTVEKKLSDNRVFVNAEMLLKESCGVRIEQVEDKGCYDAVGNAIYKLVSCGNDSSEYALFKSDLDYLQEKRTAVMLQKIPQIINDEFRQGNIRNKKAIFTIGMSHLHLIIRYLNENKIPVFASPSKKNEGENYITDLSLAKENFGVCVIIPRTLANDQKVLETNRLEKVIAASRKQASFTAH